MSDYERNELSFSLGMSKLKNSIEERLRLYRKELKNTSTTSTIDSELSEVIEKNTKMIKEFKNQDPMKNQVPPFVANYAAENKKTIAELVGQKEEQDKKVKSHLKTEQDEKKQNPVLKTLLNKKKIKGLNEYLKSNVYGQDSTINDVVNVLKIATLNIKINPDKPEGCYFFAGPSGVGKTELARALSEGLGYEAPVEPVNLKLNEEATDKSLEPKMIHIQAPILVINMGEYALEQDVTKLIGVAPGYAGFQDGGVLTNFVKNNPACIVVFDEIEKAHPSMDNILLSIMDNGSCNSNVGEKINFDKTIIIATSNLGAQVEYRNNLTKEEKDELRMEYIKKGLRPEIINRYDSTFHFNALTPEIYKKVANKFLSKLSKNILEKHDFELQYTPELIDFMVEKSYDPAMGGRPARRFIEKIVIQQLADYMLEDDFENTAKEQKMITLDLNKDRNICFKGKNRKILGVLKNTAELVAEFEAAKFTNKSNPTQEAINVLESFGIDKTKKMKR